MQELLISMYGEDELADDEYVPVMNRYLLSVIWLNFPARDQIGSPVREMRTLALGLDLIVRNKVDAAGDWLMQRR